MPWTEKDVSKYKKGLAPSEKKKWVRVANSVYRGCIKDGGSDKTCAKKAIRVANSKFSEVEDMPITGKVPKESLKVLDTEASIQFSGDSEESKGTMLGYSGKIIKDHFYWGNLAIDVSGVKFKNTIPILENHDVDRKIGFAKKPDVSNNNIMFEDITILDTPEAKQFVSNSKAGFPYEASISARPTSIERVENGEVVDVNGYKFKGPGVIWRGSEFRECSVCVIGADRNTSSKAFADMSPEDFIEVEVQPLNGFTFEEEEEPEHPASEEEFSMPFDLEKFKKEKPKEYEAFMVSLKGEVETELTEKFKTDLSAKDQEIEELKKKAEEAETTLKAKDEELTESQKSLKDLDKKVTVMQEQNLDNQAKEIWDEELSADEVYIPTHLHAKIRNHVKRTSFMSDEGEFKSDEFRSAVKKEIEEWQKDLPKDVIQGSGEFHRSAGGEEEDEGVLKEEEEARNRMKAYIPTQNKTQ